MYLLLFLAASDPSIAQQNSEKDPATDSDTTPDILHYHEDKSIHRSSESQDEIPTLKLSKLLSEQAEPEAKTSSSSNQKGAPQSDSALPSSQRRLSDCSQSLLGLMPLVRDSSSLIHTSPQRKVALERKLPISPISSHGSESKHDSNIIRNILPETSKRDNETCHSPREWRAVKRKQAPEDLDTILSAPAQQASVHREIPDCAAAVISSVPTTNNAAQTETNSIVEERSKTINGSCMDKKQTRTEQVNKMASIETAVASGTAPLRDKTLPNKPCLEFVRKSKRKIVENSENNLPAANLATTSRIGSKDPSSISQGQTSTLQAPALEMKKTKMVRNANIFFC